MDSHLIAAAHHIAKGIASSRQQITVLWFIYSCKFLVGKEFFRCSPGFAIEPPSKFIHETQGQLPWIVGGCPMAIGALYLHLGKSSPKDISIAVHFNGGVAILAEHST
jgi:hypothetical protein